MDLTTILAAFLGGSGIGGYLINRFTKAIEKKNTWQTKLFEDVYNSHKQLWEDIKVFTIEFDGYIRKPDGVIEPVNVMYFLRTYDIAMKSIIEFRDKYYLYSLFLDKPIRMEVEYLRLYLDNFSRMITIKSHDFNEKNVQSGRWVLFSQEVTQIYKADVLERLQKIQFLIENHLRSNILEHNWEEISESEWKKHGIRMNKSLEKSGLFTQAGDIPPPENKQSP